MGRTRAGGDLRRQTDSTRYPGGIASLLNVTVNLNTATGTLSAGGGINRSGGTVSLKNTIVENSSGSPTNCGGTITSQGSNLMGDASCGFNGALGDINNSVPLLGPLQLNLPNPPVAAPGNYLTHALLPGSPAIDAVSPASCPPPATDQRGVPRPQGARCDIGAYEFQSPTPIPTPTPTPCILGDVNCDGFVDIRDYGVWRQNFGQASCRNAADLNADCLADIRDYGIWRQHFGEGTPPDRPGGPPRAGVAPAPPPAPTRTPGPGPL